MEEDDGETMPIITLLDDLRFEVVLVLVMNDVDDGRGLALTLPVRVLLIGGGVTDDAFGALP